MNFPAVVKDCDRSLAINPAYVKVLLRRAAAYEELEQLEDAFADYQKVLTFDPSCYEAQRCLNLLRAVLADEGNNCINSNMIQSALSNMMQKVALKREEAKASSGAEELVFEESPLQTECRDRILNVIANTKSYFPSPSDSIYFTRMLEKMKSDKQSKWFVWGTPPISQIESVLALESTNDLQETFVSLKRHTP